MYLRSKPTLHVVDLATSFQGAKFLNAILAKETWQALRMLWINTYQGPPDILTHDAGTNFAHWSVGKIERYHAPLHRVWDILYAELAGTMSNKLTTERQVADALNTRNGPDTADMLALPLQSEVLSNPNAP
ncbi:hypothetical protein BU23DRAFT_580576 [Bimuria novae-zelandiae CBS 107.79]|uniref:Integrase catalytic domain-containing protein n=1 Tax=Bimuria novae-zelandiae CBS 107.79 TaxID=1447943 RepID=A0A6A5VAN7_9PLEO|nr:hypothetical protein BU23DRAFT_580576 [Bimuria novae-zelandiae CBS 107.79]